jgi:hypothetical protein
VIALPAYAPNAGWVVGGGFAVPTHMRLSAVRISHGSKLPKRIVCGKALDARTRPLVETAWDFDEAGDCAESPCPFRCKFLISAEPLHHWDFCPLFYSVLQLGFLLPCRGDVNHQRPGIRLTIRKPAVSLDHLQ